MQKKIIFFKNLKITIIKKRKAKKGRRKKKKGKLHKTGKAQHTGKGL